MKVASPITLYNRSFAVFVKRFRMPAARSQSASVTFANNSVQLQITGLSCSSYVASFYYFTIKSSDSSALAFTQGDTTQFGSRATAWDTRAAQKLYHLTPSFFLQCDGTQVFVQITSLTQQPFSPVSIPYVNLSYNGNGVINATVHD